MVSRIEIQCTHNVGVESDRFEHSIKSLAAQYFKLINCPNITVSRNYAGLKVLITASFIHLVKELGAISPMT